MRRSLRLLSVVLCPLLLASCSSALFAPYVRPDPAKRVDTSLAHAIKYANDTKDRYLSAAQQYAATSTIIPYVAIPLAAAALGMGMTGTTGAPITALGLGAGTAVAIGGWSQNKPREMAYNLGYQSITCLLKTVEPLQPAAAGGFQQAVFGAPSDPGSFAAARIQVRLAIARLESAMDVHGIQDAPLRDYIQSVKDYVEKTERLVADGEQLAAMASGVAANLVNNVDVVVGKINNAIRDTTPNVQAVAATISGLSVLQPSALTDLQKRDVPDPPTPGAAERGDPGLGRIAKRDAREAVRLALSDLDMAVRQLADRATVIRVAVIKSRTLKDVPTLSSCLEIPDTFSVVVRLAETSVTLKQGTTRRVAIAGGKGPYVATVTLGPAKAEDLAAKTAMNGGFFAEIAASAECPPGAYRVRVTDALGLGADVSVAVDAATPPVTASVTELEIDPAADRAVQVTIKGGKPGYSASILQATGVSATPKAGSEGVFDVAIKSTATPGSILFSDSSAPPKLTVTVPVKKR
jgi:hypothetical protein